MTRYFDNTEIGPAGLDYAADIVPLYPEGHSANERAKLAHHVSQLQHFRNTAENVITQEHALEKAREEVHAAHVKLAGKNWRLANLAKCFASMFEVYVDARSNDLSEGARHAREYAPRFAAASLFEIDAIAREYFASHPDNSFCSLAVDHDPQERW